MEIRHLITLKTIVEQGGFNKAAEYLGYAQSSITTHMKELETELGYPLFERIGRKNLLTQNGETFLSYAVKIIDLYHQSLNLDKEPQGKLVLGISESLMIYRLPPILLEFNEKYPKVNLSLKSISNVEMMDSLKNGDIDIAFIIEKKGWSHEKLHTEELVVEQMALIRPLHKKETHTALYSDLKCSYRSCFDTYIQKHNLDIQESLVFQSIEAIKQCVKNGLGLSLLPYFSVQEDLKDNKFEGEILPMHYSCLSTFLVYHKDKWLSPTAHQMIQTIQHYAQDWD